MSSIFVTIKRKPQDRIPSEIYSTSTQYIGGGYSSDSNDVLRGISFDEEEMLLPTIIGVSNTSFEFVAKAKEFHANIDIPVPQEGRKLNITTKKRTFKDKEGNATEVEYPIVPLDYIFYKHCLKHGEVANNRMEVDSHPRYRFYIENTEEIMNNSKDVLRIKNEMRQNLLKLSAEKDGDLIRAILILAKEHTGKMPSENVEENIIILDNFAEKHPVEFTSLATDNLIKARAFVNQLITFGIINSVGNQIYDEMVGADPIADSIPDFIKYLSQPKNTAYKAQLGVKLNSKKGK